MPKIRKWLKKRRYQPTFALEKVAASAHPIRARAQFDTIDATSHLVPYDENLLERSRTQWQFGDWASLAALPRDTLQHHPDRAKLALLAAAGHSAQGSATEARQYTRLAMDWGCSRRLVSQILVSGVYNTLGRSAAVGNQPHRALQHFENAIAIGTPGSDVKLVTQARSSVQQQLNVNRLGCYIISAATGLNRIKQPDLLTGPMATSLFLSLSEKDRINAIEALRSTMAETFKTTEMPPIALTSIEHKNKIFYFVHFANDYIPKKIGVTGEFYEQPFLSILACLYKPGGLILDCGANIGNHSIYFAGVMGAQVISFEPQPFNKTFLDANRELNDLGNSIVSKDVALSSEHGRIKLAMAVEGNYGTFTSDMAHVERTRGNQAFDKYEVAVSTIDSEVGTSASSVAIIKVDVEGMELSVLKGAVNTIQRSLPVIAVECFTKSIYDEIKTFLKAYGYFVLDSTNATPTFIFLTSENPFHIQAMKIILETKSVDKFKNNRDFMSNMNQ